jgi:hypothetical protein
VSVLLSIFSVSYPLNLIFLLLADHIFTYKTTSSQYHFGKRGKGRETWAAFHRELTGIDNKTGIGEVLNKISSGT